MDQKTVGHKKRVFWYFISVVILISFGLSMTFYYSLQRFDFSKLILSFGVVVASSQLLLLYRPLKFHAFSIKLLPLALMVLTNITLVVLYAWNPYGNEDLWRWFTGTSLFTFGYSLSLNYKTITNKKLSAYIRINNFITICGFSFFALLPFIELSIDMVWPIIVTLVVIIGLSNGVKNSIVRKL